MMEVIDPHIRKVLVRHRCNAMQGKLAIVSEQLCDLIAAENTAGRGNEALATAMVHAELLHLNDQDEESLALFETSIVPAVETMPQEMKFVAGHNKTQVALSLFRPPRDFYSQVDQARLMGFELLDFRGLFDAEGSAAKGEHFKALPAFWRELVRTYRQGCWVAYKWACGRLARECLAIDQPQEALWNAVMALDENLANQCAQALLARRDSAATREAVRKLIANANLSRHFSVACEAIAVLADGIPDEELDKVACWLLTRCRLERMPRLANGALYMAWKAINPIGFRLTRERAREVVDIAVNHPLWNSSVQSENSVNLERGIMVEALTRLVSALTPDDLPSLAENVIPLATGLRLAYDYDKVIELLCQIAQRGNMSLRQRLRDSLFVPGQPTPYVLGQVAEVFGAEFLSPEQLVREADRIRERILLEVQRVEPGGQPEPYPGNLGTFTTPLDDGSLVVNFASHTELEALVRQRHSLSDNAVAGLVRAALVMIRERENTLKNRASLIARLMQFGDRFDDVLLREVFDTLAPLARGEIAEPTLLPPSTASDDPMNPFKLRTGKPGSVRGFSIFALATIERSRPNCYRQQVDAILEDALSDLDPEVRWAAFAAAREMPRLSEAAFMAVLQGMRDPDPNSASAAFGVLLMKSSLKLTKSQWQLLLYAAKIASQSLATKVRSAAAAVLSRLLPTAPSVLLREQAAALCRIFATDTSASVRLAMKVPPPHEAA